MKKKIILICITIAIALACASFGVIYYMSKKIPKNPPGTVGNTSGNLYNGGLFCESGEYVYFANPYDANALYRMRPDETEMTKLVYTSVSSLNADGKFLYYYQGGSGSGQGLGFLVSTTGVYRAQKSDPSNSACLDRVVGKYVLLADNEVYYTDSGDGISLKVVSTDGKKKEKLLELDILPVCVQNSVFYYMNNEEDLSLMAYDLKTKTSRRVLAQDVYMPIINGVTVYGIDIHDDYSLVSINAPSGSKTLLDNARVDLINLADKYIYYQTSGDKPQLRRIRTDGTGMEVVAEGTYTNISATSKYVYFTKYGSTVPVYKTPVNGPVNVTTFATAENAVAAQSPAENGQTK